MSKQILCTASILVAMVLSACATITPTPTPPPSATRVPPTIAPSATPIPPTLTPRPTATPTLTPPPTPAPLPAQPRAIKFKASDGQELNGLYYPAASRTAPLVVLMHWAGGDQYDWVEIAYWLQNRGLGGKTPNPNKLAWLDSSWFPPMPAGKSLAVFTFTFRGCEGRCGPSSSRSGSLLDAQAAYKTAFGLEGVNPKRVGAIGASIGADAILDGWVGDYPIMDDFLYFSLSPGGYLGVPYADAVKTVQSKQPKANITCLYSEQDAESATACKSVAGAAAPTPSGAGYYAIAYPGSAHGMQLLDPKIQPSVMQRIRSWRLIEAEADIF